VVIFKVLKMKVLFREMTENDLDFVKEIYDDYILKTTYTFDIEPSTVSKLKEEIPIRHPVYKSFIISADGVDRGYCYYSQFKKRPAYNRTAEVSVYLKNDCTGKGIGKHALEHITGCAANYGIKNLIAVISEENLISIEFVQKNGFIPCGHLRNVGEKFGRILDVVYYQKEIG
jgi:L-amino acid N-acyltransferase YncA